MKDFGEPSAPLPCPHHLLSEEYAEDLGGRLSFKVINPKFLLKYDE